MHMIPLKFTGLTFLVRNGLEAGAPTGCDAWTEAGSTPPAQVRHVFQEALKTREASAGPESSAAGSSKGIRAVTILGECFVPSLLLTIIHVLRIEQVTFLYKIVNTSRFSDDYTKVR